MNDLKKYTVRVFVNENGKYGNPAGIIIDEKRTTDVKERQRIATELGYGESVFINGFDPCNVNIFNPKTEVPFAGHALVGTAWIINKINKYPVESINCICGQIKVWSDNGLTWIQANTAIMPSWNYEQLNSAGEIKNFSKQAARTKEHTYIWSWLDKSKGQICARTFASDWGIPEDEANGSGSMKLAAILGKELEIRHGKGSIIYVKPGNMGMISLGGRVIEDKNQRGIIGA